MGLRHLEPMDHEYALLGGFIRAPARASAPRLDDLYYADQSLQTHSDPHQTRDSVNL